MLNIRSIIIYTSRSYGVNLPAGAVFQESAKTNHVSQNLNYLTVKISQTPIQVDPVTRNLFSESIITS